MHTAHWAFGLTNWLSVLSMCRCTTSTASHPTWSIPGDALKWMRASKIIGITFVLTNAHIYDRPIKNVNSHRHRRHGVGSGCMYAPMPHFVHKMCVHSNLSIVEYENNKLSVNFLEVCRPIFCIFFIFFFASPNLFRFAKAMQSNISHVRKLMFDH